MKYLTLSNSIADLNNFAANAALPFDRHGASNAANAPWVMMGGSYSGALSAWTASTAPGTIWAYHASSAPVEAISDYWSYFLPVQQGMPKNCSKDVNLVIEHMDSVMLTGTEDEKHELKAMFGLEDVEHDDDFMAALEWAPWLWQGNQFYANTGFFTWCDFVENAVNETDPAKIPGEEGVGLEKALKGYAKWGKEYVSISFHHLLGNGIYVGIGLIVVAMCAVLPRFLPGNLRLLRRRTQHRVLQYIQRQQQDLHGYFFE